MKILIIGGTGLISTAMSREFLARSDELTLYNRGKSEARIPKRYKLLTGDRRDYPTFEAQMATAGTFDCVIDMIGYDPADAASDIRAFKGRCGHFIFCSTVDVYSKPPSRFPVLESESRSGALGTYGQNKVKCEDLFFAAHHHGDLPITIIRPAHTYGEGGGIIHSFGWSSSMLDRIRRGKPVIVHGDGQSLWVSCHIDDVAHAFVHAAGNPVTYGKAYHTAGEEWLTWNGYHQGVAKAMNAPTPQLVHIPTDLLYRAVPDRSTVLYINFQFDNVFDNSAARQDLDFHYTVPWVDGARRTINWLEERDKIENSDTDPLYDRVIAAWEKLSGQMVAALKEK